MKDDRQLVLLDSRGHGQSDKPQDPAAYDLALRALDVFAVLDALDIGKANYFGYSLGGWIGFEVARRAPDRFNSFIFGGARPYAEDMQVFRNLIPRDSQTFYEGDGPVPQREPPLRLARAVVANALVPS